MPRTKATADAHRIDLGELFRAHQSELLNRLGVAGNVVSHPTAKGDAAELDWIGMLSDFLPTRYQVGRAFVVDSEGGLSEQIDIVVYDRHYSPLLFHHQGALYVPAESVYAVFEVKSLMKWEHIGYASGKAASVRRLKRTSVTIPHAGGTHRPKKLFHIPAGLLATDNNGAGHLKQTLARRLDGHDRLERLELGCVVAKCGFEVAYSGRSVARVETSSPELSASFFMLRLLSRLQQLATVPALDFGRYLEAATGKQ